MDVSDVEDLSGVLDDAFVELFLTIKERLDGVLEVDGTLEGFNVGVAGVLKVFS